MQKTAFSIYNASAGSGKTYTLVKEYLKIILTSKKPDAYRNILAITFTNKAVHEMKSRVLDSLSEFSKQNPSEKAIELMQDINIDTGLSLQAITHKSQSIIKNLIHNYAAFDISTIDKFTHKVIRAFAHELNLPITFEVSLDVESLLAEAVDTIIAEAGIDAELTKLLIDFTMEKTDEDKSWDISREIMETGKLILNENNREEIIHFNDKKIEDFMIIKSKLFNLCQQLETETAELAIGALTLIESKGIDEKSFSGGHFPRHLKSIAQKQFNPKNKMYHEIDDIKINKTANDSAIIQSIIPNLLVSLDTVYQKFEKINFYQAFLKNITPLSLLNTLSNKLKEIQKDQGVLSITEFNKLVHEQIQNQPAPFIYERLGEKYKHFFIDEFQDTSEMQWQNLVPLIDNATSSEDLIGERGSLLIVGDPKQSIYRWRGGKAEQFIELSKSKNPFNNPDKKVHSLETNYRSFSEIISFNNKFFRFIANEFSNQDYKDLYKNHSCQKENNKKGGYVNISFISLDKTSGGTASSGGDVLEKEDLYLLETYNTIENVKSKGFSYKEIVILTRKKSEGSAIANYLNQKGVPILSSESLLIGASSEVQCIVAVLCYLKNKRDSEAKAIFLYYIASNNNLKLDIHDFIADGIALQKEAELESWLAKSNIYFSFVSSGKKSLYEVVEKIISSIIPLQKQNAYVQYFLDIVLEQDLVKNTGISDFLNYWNLNSGKLSIPSPEGKEAVRIMTIHTSKGLEFPVVIFPFAEEDYTKGPREKMWLSADSSVIGLPKILVDKNNNVANFGEESAQAYVQKKQEELLDDINVLYVALTRAEEQLYIISGVVSKNQDQSYPANMASFFITFLEDNQLYDLDKLVYEFGSSNKLSVSELVKENTKTIPRLEATLHPNNIKIAQRESLMWDTKQQKAIEYGNVLHEILSLIQYKDDLDLAITKSIESGLITAEQRGEVNKTLANVLNHCDLSAYFCSENKVLNERTIIQNDGNLLKPDRLVINTNKEVLLLDYKTGAKQSKYQKQLSDYQIAIEKMGYKVTKKALVFIGETVEVINL